MHLVGQIGAVEGLVSRFPQVIKASGNAVVQLGSVPKRRRGEELGHVKGLKPSLQASRPRGRGDWVEHQRAITQPPCFQESGLRRIRFQVEGGYVLTSAIQPVLHIGIHQGAVAVLTATIREMQRDGATQANQEHRCGMCVHSCRRELTLEQSPVTRQPDAFFLCHRIAQTYKLYRRLSGILQPHNYNQGVNVCLWPKRSVFQRRSCSS